MSSPSMVHRSGDTLIVRSVVSGDPIFVNNNNNNEPDTFSDESDEIDYGDDADINPYDFDIDDDELDGSELKQHPLPECKVRRNYSCNSCVFFTQNPRYFLYHLRDVHKEKVKIYECPNCLYASKHFQKLVRHMKMVHVDFDTAELMEITRAKSRRKRKKNIAHDEPPQESPAEEDGLNDAEDEDARVEPIEELSTKSSDLKCSLCSFTTKHQGQLTRHERQEHIKTKFFRCSKCSYVTHIKARFTKHVKYHSMPMIKCDLCDFRTPYKWNLDRHYKNHNGHGTFRCSACNFTADIKQSLTVHEMNHHVPPVGQAAGLGVGRRRNKVGASDTTAAEDAAAAAAAAVIDVPKDFSQVSDTPIPVDVGHNKKSPKIRISIKKLKTQHEQNERHNFETDFIHPDDIIHHSNGNVYIKNKCKLCNFKTAWDTEMVRHEWKTHNIHRDIPQQQQQHQQQQVKKTSRPIPNLIPIQNSPPSGNMLKIPQIINKPQGRADDYPADVISQKDLNEMCAKSTNSSLRDFASLFAEDLSCGKTDAMKTTPKSATNSVFKKKNASFFDKLKEKLMTDAGETTNLTCKWCGHESKCLSESAGHQKICGKQTQISVLPQTAQNTISSTRCQYCRQRCKSSMDLHNHLEICSEANKPSNPIEFRKSKPKESYEAPKEYEFKHEKPDITIKLEEPSIEPHPMENVTFVWNNITPLGVEIEEQSDSLDLSMRVQTPESEELNFMDLEHTVESISSPVKMPTHGNDLDMVAEGRRVFKCPHCSFWATTASRFHVHIVGHLNKKPFECSLCAYRSNWRWDITKHIRLKSVRDPEHEKARVLMTDETGRRNYSKYNKYLTQLKTNDGSQEICSPGRRSKAIDSHEKAVVELPKLTRAPTNIDFLTRGNALRPPPPLKAANELYFNFGEPKKRPASDVKKTLFKCKKCNFRDASRENILLHVKGHYSRQPEVEAPVNLMSAGGGVLNDLDEASCLRGQAPFRCGHCHQVSNWKHVIQRHCRLKHSGDVRVVVGGKNGAAEKIECEDQSDEPDHVDVVQSGTFKCQQCPFSTNTEHEFNSHTNMHLPKPNSSMKCYFCPYYVAQKHDLFDHLKLHGVSNPEDYVNRAMQGRELVALNSLETVALKRYKCVWCPYVSNSKSQFLYHKQFHRHRGGPFKCEFCSYNVTRRHLLHQHLKVHGVAMPPQKKSNCGSDRESDCFDPEDIGFDEFEELPLEAADEQVFIDIPLVWVARDGKFSKMFKCRYCPHVNQRKVNIQEHEKMHTIRNPNSPRQDEHHCNECSYICNNAGVLSSHLKVHQSCYGQIHCLVDTNKTDEEQVSELTSLLNLSTQDSPPDVLNPLDTSLPRHSNAQNSPQDFAPNSSQVPRDLTIQLDKSDLPKLLYFCEHCPARFLHDKEFSIHKRFHGLRLFYRCEYCSYTSRQRPHLLSHNKVHTEEYQEKTKQLLTEFPVNLEHPAPTTCVIVNAPGNSESVWVVIASKEKENPQELSLPVKTSKTSFKKYGCTKCPARFFKNDLLSYHMTLHGCNNPYKCKFCDYAARTSSNLQKHVRIHQQPSTTSKLTSTVPLSGTELFQHKAEANKKMEDAAILQPAVPQKPLVQIDPQFGTLMNGNPDFVYPTYLKNGRMKEKKYKCHKCPSAFEKREQYKVHLSLHGSKQRYKCEYCDYSVKYYANYIQHTRKHKTSIDAKPNEENKSNISETILESSFPKLAIKTLNSSSKRGPLKLSVADKQTLMILQQRRASNASSTKESEDKKMFWCPHCPYSSYRRDAVDNHVNRHIIVSGLRSNYTCDHCDYTVPQSHFLREHSKMHFTGQKNHVPEGYMMCANLKLSTSKCDGDGDTKELIFEDSGVEDAILRFKPKLDQDFLNNNDVQKLFVNLESGEVVTKEQNKSF